MLEKPTLIGCDFTSRPTRQKPITVAVVRWLPLDLPTGRSRSVLKTNETLQLNEIHRFDNFIDFERFLSTDCAELKGPWVGGFDLPFGLPRELVQTLCWPLEWGACVQHYCTLERSQIREIFKDFCANRPSGSKFAHRETDYVANSSPSMKWVNPPVAYMLHAGIPVLIKANLTLPGIRRGNLKRIGLETYPGILAREIVGHQSYKSDDKQKQNSERLLPREKILKTLVKGDYSLGFKIKTSKAQANQLLEDASGDSLDALMCAVQAAWGAKQFEQGNALYGLPSAMDPLEGWILTC